MDGWLANALLQAALFFLAGNFLTSGVPATFVCPRAAGQFADPDNCHIFYQCENNISYRLRCPPGSLYDGQKGECVNRHEIVVCGPQPSTIPPITTPDPNAAPPCDLTLCQLPFCYCSPTGTEIPGGLAKSETPQMVMVTFDGAINHLNFDVFNTLFLENRTNPNGCPVRGTFFMTHDWTDYSLVQDLYSKGHEMAVASVSRREGLENSTEEQWVGEMVTMREILSNFAFVHPDDVVGMRAPHLRPAKNVQFQVMIDYGFVYDSSMVVPPQKLPVWPYTLDYERPHECKSGSCPTASFPGIWEIPMNYHYKDELYEAGFCPYLDQCGLNLFPEDEVYDWLKKDFHRHYDRNRAPYLMPLSIVWFNTPANHKALLRFMDYTLTLPDVYYTTMTETVQWMTNPQPTSKLSTYEAFDCTRKQLPDPPCEKPTSCALVLDATREEVPKGTGGQRYLTTCAPTCPLSYPWSSDARGLGKGTKDTYQTLQF